MKASRYDAWVRCSQPHPQARLRLFCFPYAGGGASIYRTWSAGLPRDIEVCAIQLPGRENRLSDPPFIRLTLLVRTLAQVLGPYLDIPFAFFGHSMGALLSFELARHLRRQKRSGPVHLFVSGHRAPQLPDPDPPIHRLPDPMFVAELRRLNGTPEEVLQNAELRQLVLPVLRADFAICETYDYSSEEPLDCPIFAFGGTQDDEVSRDELGAWREQTSSSFRLRMFPGDHFFLHSAQALLMQDIAEELTAMAVTGGQRL